ncbi:MAG: Ig-like domain repeat protein [Candidatus Competibacteraceae bacterium]
MYGLALDSSSRLYVGGAFTTLGGQTRNRLARVASTGAVDTWYPAGGANDAVGALAVDNSSNNVYVGGSFATLGGSVHLAIAQVSTTGTGTPTANWARAGYPGSIFALTRDSAGRTYVGGNFAIVDGVERKNLLRFNADGSLDTTWYPAGGANNTVNALALDSSNNVYVGGAFTTLGGQTRNRLARVASTGAVDTWYPAGGIVDTNGVVNALALDSSSRLYVGGYFSTLGGQTRYGIARVASTGAVDTTWYPNSGVNGTVNALALDSSNRLYIGGDFTTCITQTGSQPCLTMTRITSTGTLDTTWPPSLGASTYGIIFTLALDGSNNLYVGGLFSVFQGWPRNGIARISSADTLDSWYPARGVNGGIVRALAVDSNNHIYVGGEFYDIGGQIRVGLAALATPRLTVASINGGAAPAVNTPFDVTLELRDSTNALSAADTTTVAQLAVKTGASTLGRATIKSGTGTLSGNTSCTINVGASGCTVTGAIYSQVETNVVLDATTTSGDVAEPGDSPAFEVVKATPTISLSRAPNTDTPVGQSVTFTATVAATPPGSGTPSGTVTFNDGATSLCANVTLSSGSAVCATNALSLGSHSLTAVYSGDANFTGGTSAVLIHTVNSALQAPAITSAATATFTVGQAGSFTVTATGTPAPTLSSSGTLPSGVSFTNGTLSGTPAAGTENTYSLVLTASNGVGSAATQNFTLTVQGSDNDLDGYRTPDDCNDNDPAIHPGAAEVCDRQDNDCDPTTVERCPLGCPQLTQP